MGRAGAGARSNPPQRSRKVSRRAACRALFPPFGLGTSGARACRAHHVQHSLVHGQRLRPQRTFQRRRRRTARNLRAGALSRGRAALAARRAASGPHPRPKHPFECLAALGQLRSRAVRGRWLARLGQAMGTRAGSRTRLRSWCRCSRRQAPGARTTPACQVPCASGGPGSGRRVTLGSMTMKVEPNPGLLST